LQRSIPCSPIVWRAVKFYVRRKDRDLVHFAQHLCKVETSSWSYGRREGKQISKR
jgi:hypothetical protein